MKLPAAFEGPQGKRLRIALVAVLALGGFLYMRSARSGGVVDTGVPAGGGLNDSAPGTALAGSLEGDPALANLQAELANFIARVNDQFGHFQDLEDAYGQLKAGTDPFGAIPSTDAYGDVPSTGAGDSLNPGEPPAVPGNSKIRSVASFAAAARAAGLAPARKTPDSRPPAATLPDVKRKFPPKPTPGAKAHTKPAKPTKKKKKKVTTPARGASSATGRSSVRSLSSSSSVRSISSEGSRSLASLISGIGRTTSSARATSTSVLSPPPPFRPTARGVLAGPVPKLAHFPTTPARGARGIEAV